MNNEFIKSCVEKLNEDQLKDFLDFGLRQIKWMFENDSVIETPVPSGSVLVGLSKAFMRWTAIDYDKKIRYSFFPHTKYLWSEATEYKPELEYHKIGDLEFIYNTFKLKDYELDVLTNVHREVSKAIVDSVKTYS